MTAHSSNKADRTPPMKLQRIRINRDGYDSDGAYWGAGADVFIASLHDGVQEITVRAKSIAQAREKVTVELARAPGAPQSEPRDAIGGASPNKSRFEIDWRDPVAGTAVRIRVTHSRDYLGMGQDHIEVESTTPKKVALPISETGYRSQFMTSLELINAGGPVTFVRAWLDREARSKDWQKRQAARQQGDLFQWAEAEGEVAKRQRSPKPKRPDATPKRARRRDRDPA